MLLSMCVYEGRRSKVGDGRGGRLVYGMIQYVCVGGKEN